MKKVKPGDRLQIPAGTYNAFIDAAQDYINRRSDESRDPIFGGPSASVVLVKNSSGADVDQYGILGIDGPVIEPSNNLPEFESRVLVDCDTPAVADHIGRFVVLLEPIPNGEIGRGIIDGVTICRVVMNDEADRFAEITDGDATVLSSAGTGSAALLWVEPIADRDGDPWAIVRIGGGGGGGTVWVQFVAYDTASTFTAHIYNGDTPSADTVTVECTLVDCDDIADDYTTPGPLDSSMRIPCGYNGSTLRCLWPFVGGCA